MKIPDAVSIAATKLVRPPALSTEEALRRGLASASAAQEVGALGLPVAEAAGAPRLAVDAARAALSAAAVPGDGVQLVVHAWVHHQGHDFWSPAHYIAREIGATAALPIGIQAMCNGGETALEIAVTRLLSDARATTAVVTTADIFAGDFDRWNSDSLLWYGDAGTALVLTTAERGGDPLLLSFAAESILEGERLHRGDDDFSWAPRQTRDQVSVRSTKQAFAARSGLQAFATAMRDAVRRVVMSAIVDAGLTPDSPRLRYLALPRVGRRALNELYAPAVAGLTRAEAVYLGDETGHLGAGDTAANLDDLLRRADHAPDDVGLFLCAGAGFTVSCVAVRLGSRVA